MCGIVGGGGDIRNEGEGRGGGGGGGGGGLSWLQVGSKPGLETVQGLGCHYFLGKAVPFRYGPGEE